MGKTTSSTKPIIYLLGGCNGAGKTTFAKTFLPRTGVLRFLNVDEMARGLSPLDVEAAAFRAGRLLMHEFRSAMRHGASFGLESTLSGRTYLGLLRQARDAGFEIELHYLWLPSAREAVRRVQQRVREGGHSVPAHDIQQRYQRSMVLFVESYASAVDRWFLWDNSSPPARMLARAENHSIVQLRDFFRLP